MRSLLRLRRKPLLALLVLLTLVPGFISWNNIRIFASASHSSTPQITLSIYVGPPTDQVNATGRNFGSSEIVNITFATQLVGTATTSSKGTFTKNIIIPQSALPGTYTIQAVGQTSKLMAKTTFLVRTDWAVDGFDAHRTHDNPYENTINTLNVSGLTLDWQYLTKNYINTSPVVDDGMIFIASTDQNLYALDAKTGSLKWTVTPGPSPTTPAVADGMVFIGAANGSIYAFDEKTGYEWWHFTTAGSIVSAPLVADKMVFVASTDRTMYAFDEQTGGMVWNIENSNGFAAPATYANGVIYLCMESETLIALDARTGLEKWSVNSVSAGGGEVVVDNNLVYTTGAGVIAAFNAVNGKQKWIFRSQQISATYSEAVASGVVYVGMADSIYALNGKTGQILWTYVGPTQVMISPSPAFANGLVYFCSGTGYLYALDAQQGILKWSYSDDFALSSPVIVNGIVYIGSYNGNLDAFHLAASQS
jgi:outer membrane protein assembly factor BamB